MKTKRKIPLIEQVSIEKNIKTLNLNENKSPSKDIKTVEKLKPFSESKTFQLFSRPITNADYK
jgi:hypothetical protein